MKFGGGAWMRKLFWALLATSIRSINPRVSLTGVGETRPEHRKGRATTGRRSLVGFILLSLLAIACEGSNSFSAEFVIVSQCGDLNQRSNGDSFTLNPGNNGCRADIRFADGADHVESPVVGTVWLQCEVVHNCGEPRALYIVHPDGACIPFRLDIPYDDRLCSDPSVYDASVPGEEAPLNEPVCAPWRGTIRKDVTHYVVGYERQLIIESGDDLGPSCLVQFSGCFIEQTTQRSDSPLCR